MLRGFSHRLLPLRTGCARALGVLACALAPLWASPQITDVTLKFAGKIAAEIHFAPPEEGQTFSFPPYFQKIDSARKTALFSFLETETSLPMGFTPLPSQAPVAGVTLQRFRSPSGKDFLGVEFSLKRLPATADWSLIPTGSILRIFLGKAPKSAASLAAWSLAQGSAAPPVTPTASSAPAAEASAPATPAPAASPGKLREVRITAAGSWEEVSFQFQGQTPDYRVENPSGTAPALGLIFHHTEAAPPEAKFDLGPLGRVRGLFWQEHDSDLVAVLLLDSAQSLQPTAEKSNVRLRIPLPPGTPAFSWKSRHPVTPRVPVGPLPSAFAEGATLDQKHAHALTSSHIFTLAPAGKPMVVVRDSAPLLAGPGKSVAVRRWLQAGENLRRLGSHAGYLRAVADNDTGYVAAAAAAYPDELSAAQLRALQAKIHARQTAAQAAVAPAGKPRAEEPPAPPAPPATAVHSKKTEEPKLSLAAPGAKMEIPPTALDDEQKAADSEKVNLAPPSSEAVTYNSYGRRDPFIPVEQGSPDNGIDIDEMKVVGIVWQGEGPMAVLENIKESNLSFTVRPGDPVHNGHVARITRDAVTFDLTEFGITRSYTLKLVPSQERAGK